MVKVENSAEEGVRIVNLMKKKKISWEETKRIIDSEKSLLEFTK